MADRYDWLRLRAAGLGSAGLVDVLRQSAVPAWAEAGFQVWGMWQGLFGIGADELLVMTAGSGEAGAGLPREALPRGTAVLDGLELLSTVRPQGTQPLSDPGLYVFRTFDLRPADCDPVVALSQQAWETFEVSERYRSRPCGLFRPRLEEVRDGADLMRMLLVTWYDGFASWEASRNPAPAARDNFARRRALTAGTVAYATRLVPPA